MRSAIKVAIGLLGLSPFVLAGAGWYLLAEPDRRQEDRLRDSLTASVQGAQRAVWNVRETLVSDPESGIGKLEYANSLIDVRREKSAVNEGWHLIELTHDSDKVVLTLATSARVGPGGFLGQSSLEARTCFELRVPSNASQVQAVGVVCPSTLDDRVVGVPTEEITVDDSVLDASSVPGATDPPSMNCQCRSGGPPCECPGG